MADNRAEFSELSKDQILEEVQENFQTSGDEHNSGVVQSTNDRYVPRADVKGTEDSRSRAKCCSTRET